MLPLVHQDPLCSRDLALNFLVDSMFLGNSGVFAGVGAATWSPPGKTDPDEEYWPAVCMRLCGAAYRQPDVEPSRCPDQLQLYAIL